MRCHYAENGNVFRIEQYRCECGESKCWLLIVKHFASFSFFLFSCSEKRWKVRKFFSFFLLAKIRIKDDLSICTRLYFESTSKTIIGGRWTEFQLGHWRWFRWNSRCTHSDSFASSHTIVDLSNGKIKCNSSAIENRLYENTPISQYFSFQ